MVVMNLTLDGIYNFNDFNIDFSVPADDEISVPGCGYLRGRPNFRYKKVVILMAASATGKTNLGRVLYNILGFFYHSKETFLTDMVASDSVGSLSINFVSKDPFPFDSEELFLHHFSAKIDRKNSDVQLDYSSTRIAEDDTYEKCAERLAKKSVNYDVRLGVSDYVLMRAVSGSWLNIAFSHGCEFWGNETSQPDPYVNFSQDIPTMDFARIDKAVLLHTLKAVVGTIDPELTDFSVYFDDSYSNFTISGEKTFAIMLNEKLYNWGYLSEGTIDGIIVAIVLAMVLSNSYDFHYCDNLFSRIHTNIEKSVFEIMARSVKENEQLIFATNNINMLDLNASKFPYVFLKKEVVNGNSRVSATWASDVLKHDFGSLRYAVEADKLLSSPDCSLLKTLENEKSNFLTENKRNVPKFSGTLSI